MGTAHLSLETWVAIGLIATIGILIPLRTLGIHMEHSLMLTALKREARRLRAEQKRRLRALEDKEEVTAVDVLHDDGTFDEETTGEPELSVETPPMTEAADAPDPDPDPAPAAQPMADAW